MAAAGGGLAVIPTAPERTRNADNDFPFRFDSSFHYLTGFTEPQAWLLLDSSGRSLLACRPRDPEREIWDGFRLGPQAAVATLGVDAACSLAELETCIEQRLAGQPALWLPCGVHDGLAAQAESWMGRLRSLARHGVEAPQAQRDLSPLLAELRLRKDADELNTLRRACAISAGAHVRAMRFCAERLSSGVASLREYELEAELLHEFRRHGAHGPAYSSIVAAGPNACVLHHVAGDAELRPGQLCLIDAGCELDGYASDITRTFPASGRFSAPQRELYELVLAAQAAAVAATRPGARQRDAHAAAVRVLAQGMLDTGLLPADRHGGLDDVIDSAAYRQFFMHGTGHWLGRDVHDVGEYLALDEAPVDQPDDRGGRIVKKPSRVLQPGMVVTLEPGLYVRPAPGVPEHFWHLGIRIEDDAVVTASGCEVISRGVPVQADDIEALMR